MMPGTRQCPNSEKTLRTWRLNWSYYVSWVDDCEWTENLEDIGTFVMSIVMSIVWC